MKLDTNLLLAIRGGLRAAPDHCLLLDDHSFYRFSGLLDLEYFMRRSPWSFCVMHNIESQRHHLALFNDSRITYMADLEPFVGTVPSRRSKETYRVERLSGGAFTCTCPGFLNSKRSPKSCRHTLAFALMLSDAPLKPSQYVGIPEPVAPPPPPKRTPRLLEGWLYKERLVLILALLDNGRTARVREYRFNSPIETVPTDELTEVPENEAPQYLVAMAEQTADAAEDLIEQAVAAAQSEPEPEVSGTEYVQVPQRQTLPPITKIRPGTQWKLAGYDDLEDQRFEILSNPNTTATPKAKRRIRVRNSVTGVINTIRHERFRGAIRAYGIPKPWIVTSQAIPGTFWQLAGEAGGSLVEVISRPPTVTAIAYDQDDYVWVRNNSAMTPYQLGLWNFIGAVQVPEPDGWLLVDPYPFGKPPDTPTTSAERSDILIAAPRGSIRSITFEED
jgi:hypothetical protein